MEDPDIECTAVIPPAARATSRLPARASTNRGGDSPESPSEWFAYDAIILSNMPREALSDQQVAWVDEWIARRGGGLGMVGGPYSFASGRWAGTAIGAMLPVALRPGGDDWEERPTSIEPLSSSALHPIWHIATDDSENRALLKALPAFVGQEPPGPGQAGRRDACRRRRGWPGGRDRRATLRAWTDDGDDHRDQPPLGERFQPDLGRKRRALLQEVLEECGVLAHRELVDRPAAAPRRDRQAALQPWRPGRHPRPHLRRKCGPDTRLPRDRDGRAGLGRRCHVGRLSPAAADGQLTTARCPPRNRRGVRSSPGARSSRSHACPSRSPIQRPCRSSRQKRFPPVAR